MKIFQKTKSGLKRVFGAKEIGDNYQSIKGMAKELYDYNTTLIGHTGQKKTIYVPKVLLDERERDFRNLFLLFASILLLTLFYLFYLILHHLWYASLLLLCFDLFIASLCFRYHFWWVQIKKRKLGCTFEEWKDETVKEIKDLTGRDQS